MSEQNSKLKVIWKRPDGFHGAEPDDFYSIELGHSKLWLHKHDTDEFPFRVSGDWEEQEASKKLNNLINNMSGQQSDMIDYLTNEYAHSNLGEPSKFLEDTKAWVHTLRSSLKGDTWELDIMSSAFDALSERLESITAKFLERAKT